MIVLQGLGLLVANEKKQRTRSQVLWAAMQNVKEHDPKEPNKDMNLSLVRCVGKVRNEKPIDDHVFKVTCQDSYRLKRIV